MPSELNAPSQTITRSSVFDLVWCVEFRGAIDFEFGTAY
jgi:hypothetical protein